MPKSATCHPERKHYAHGLCKSCYIGQFKKSWVNPNKAACHPDRPHHASGLCAACYVPSRPGWREQNIAGARKRKLQRSYGLTEDAVQTMLAGQDGKCAACGTDITGTVVRKDGRLCPVACVDHCHTTGVVRGLLCGKCNAGIGYFDDDPARLECAAAYLRRNA